MSTLVRHVMATDPATARVDMNACDAAGLMASFDVGAVPILDGDRLVGLVTDRDLTLRVLAARRDPLQTLLGDIVTRHTVHASPDMTLSEARDLMAEHRVRRLPVCKGDELVGIVSLGDVAVGVSSKRAVGETLSEVSESPATTDRSKDGPDEGTPDRVHAVTGKDVA